MSQSPAFQSNRNNQRFKPAAPQNRTTVLHLVGDMELRAEAREVVDLSIQTHRSGWRPLIASSGGSLVLEAERGAVRHTKLPLKTKSLFRSWRNRVHVERLIERERPVLIHAHGYDVIGLASKIAVRRNLPLLIDLTEPSPVTPRRHKMLQLAASRGAHFRVPSNYMIKHLTEDLKITTDRLNLVWPGVDLQWFDAARVTPERINQLHRLWRLPEQSTVIVMATPFAPGYGHKPLLDALVNLQSADLYVILIGDDRVCPGMRGEIEKLVIEKGLEGKIIMPENCTDWPAACWLSSLFLATNGVPRGQVPELLAAQAIGRPVIVTDCGANAEMVQKDETAWVIPVEDKDALVAALHESLAMGPARRIDLAIHTRAFINENFTMEAWRDATFALYDSMLAPPALATAAAA